MKENLKQLLIRDLCARLPYGVNILADIDKEFDGGAIRELVGIIPHKGIEGELLFYQKGCLTPLSIEEIRPYLRPMSSMTEEEKVIFDNVLKSCDNKVFACPVGQRRYNFFDAEQEDFMNAHHFDYRGLIPMGLALEAPEGMYKNE